MIREDLQEAGQIIENILSQPLNLPDSNKDLTLLSAALTFQDEAPENTALFNILKSFLDHPETKDVLIRELEILADELKS